KNPKAFHIKLLNEVEKTSAHTVFISSESFEYSKSIQSIINLKNIFGPYFTIKILMYIRRQDFLLESIYKQHVKMGLATDIKSFYNKTKIYYLDVLNNWASVFGDEQIDVKVFDDEEVK